MTDIDIKEEIQMRVLPGPKAPRVPIGIRVTPQMRDSLINAAQTSGRSVTQEIEVRLELADYLMRFATAIPQGEAA
jgi:TraY domain